MLPTSPAVARSLPTVLRHLIAVVRSGDIDQGSALVSQLDRTDLEHLVIMLAVSPPDPVPEVRREVAALVAERYTATHPPRQ